MAAQSSFGFVEHIQDFVGFHSAVAETTDFLNIDGFFYAGGEGFEDNDTGLIPKDATEANGVAQLISGNTDADTSFVGTKYFYKPSVNGNALFECKIQLPDLDTKEIFFGLTNIWTFDEQLEDAIINASATAVTCVADLAGFYFSDELTASATYWHGFSAGGTAADQNTAATNVLNNHTDATAANTWQILKLEVDADGTCRWYINGKLEQTVNNAIATDSLYALVLANAANTTQLVVSDIDYIAVRTNRDHTV